ncbi:MAG: class I SAM-dependent methyltransferase [Bacteroidia bacterium]
MQTKSSSSDISSASKLTARLSANSHASRDFDEWCLRQFPELLLGANVLDLGCGTGKQVSLFAPLLSASSKFYGIDLSGESLDILKKDYSSPPQLELIGGSFDEMEKINSLEGGTFDLIYASYALYYTKDLGKVINDVFRLLKPSGIFWVICPYSGTNQEFLSILRTYHEVEPFMDYVFDDFHKEVIAFGEKSGFRSLKPSLLRNKIHFPSAESFMKYLKNSLFYREGFDREILSDVQKVVDNLGEFPVSKHIVSLQLRK